MREKFGFIVGLPAFLFRLWYCFYFAAPLETVSTILMFAQLILLVGVILPTERALRRNFDSLGNPKEKNEGKRKIKTR